MLSATPTKNVIAGYDVLGESSTNDQAQSTLYQQITAAIRQVDPNHTLIYEGNDAALSVAVFTAPFDSNEMISPHDYPWEEPLGNPAGNFVAYDAAAKKLNAPLFIGEFGQGVMSTLQQEVGNYNADPLVAGWTQWTYKQSPGFPSLQTIQHTPASQMLINWINNTSRPKPTLVQAQQGMSDFINAIKFANTIPNAQLAQMLH